MMDERSFSGGVFSEVIDGGRSGAQIELSRTGLSARTVEGECFVLAYSECQVEVGGFSGRMVFCRGKDRSLTIFCEDRAFPAALSEASAGVLAEQIGRNLKERRTESRRARWIGAAILAGMAILLVAGYFGVRAGARAAVHAVPISVDREIGSTALENMDLGGPEVTDSVVVEALQSMVDRLEPHAAIEGIDFEVHVVDAPMVNAFVLPGGKIVVFTGLLAAADDPDQVAAVLAHEMAHATLRHHLQQLGQSLGIAAAIGLLLGDTGGLVGTGAELVQAASINSYSREQENAADEEAVRVLHAADIDPLALTRFFETLKAEYGELPEVVSWISTHPRHEERIAAIKDQLAALPKREYQPAEIDWAEVQQRIEQD